MQVLILFTKLIFVTKIVPKGALFILVANFLLYLLDNTQKRELNNENQINKRLVFSEMNGFRAFTTICSGAG